VHQAGSSIGKSPTHTFDMEALFSVLNV